MNYRKFEELPVWQRSLEATKIIYDLSANAKWSKDFGLKDQIRRAIVSVSSTIVEGFEKNNNNEFVRFLRMAKGSVGEVRNQLYIALSIGYISQSEFEAINLKMEKLAGEIGGLIVYLENFKKNQSAIRNSQSKNPR